MNEERAVYKCHWVESGTNYEESGVQIPAEETGAISLCTFPGFGRVNEKGEMVYIVKATVRLESVLN